MNNRLISTLLIFFCFSPLSWIHAQEMEQSLDFNPNLKGINFLKAAHSDTLELPFFDDFSNSGPLPLSSHWRDNHVYINSHFEVDPISTGVATFDGLNAQGEIYSGSNTAPYLADYLTSQPINLAGKRNVTLSFFYQPQGLGTKPESGDSLILEFKNPIADTITFTPVWSVDGSELQPFKRVYIPVNGGYLYKGFQFRFKNYVSIGPDRSVKGIGSNTDYWNLDYVLLDTTIVRNDTILGDVCFRAPIPEILETYRSIPWDHFPAARLTELKSQLKLDIYSYNSEVRQADMQYTFYEYGYPDNRNTYSYNPFNLDPQTTIPLEKDIIYDFISESSIKGRFGVTCHFRDVDADINRTQNDTLHKFYNFLDYYAHDDGTAEAGYGFQGIGSDNSMFALKFKTYQPDTLQAINMYFNATKNGTNHGLPFVLTVWAVNEDGKPGAILWEKQVSNDSITNEFIRFELASDAPFIENDFFIGWQQLEQDAFLNAGLDKNTSSTGNAYYNTNGPWEQSNISGTVMMRPSFDSEIPLSVKNLSAPITNSVRLYPNPASSFITIERETSNFEAVPPIAEILSLQGQVLVIKELRSAKETIPFSLKRGIYLLRIMKKNIPTYSGKIIVQ